MASPRHNIVKNALTSFLKKEYGFVPSDQKVGYFADRVIKELNMSDWSDADLGLRGFAARAYRHWFSKTGMDQRTRARHSAMGFTAWLSRNYLIIPIRKFWVNRDKV